MLGKNVWGKLSSCDHGIKEGNGQRKVQNGAICVNPYHYAPIEILSLVRPLVMNDPTNNQKSRHSIVLMATDLRSPASLPRRLTC